MKVCILAIVMGLIAGLALVALGLAQEPPKQSMRPPDSKSPVIEDRDQKEFFKLYAAAIQASIAAQQANQAVQKANEALKVKTDELQAKSCGPDRVLNIAKGGAHDGDLECITKPVPPKPEVKKP